MEDDVVDQNGSLASAPATTMRDESTLGSTRLDDGLEARSRPSRDHSEPLLKQVDEWVPEKTWGAQVIAEARQRIEARPDEVASGDGVERQLKAVARDCIAWRLLELVDGPDPWAAERLVAMYRLQLRGMIRAVAGAIQDADAEDIAQNVWLALWRKPPKRRQVSRSLTPFFSWMKTVARYRTLSFLVPDGGRRKLSERANIARLFEHTQGGEMSPQAALTAAIYAFGNVEPVDIALNFATKSLQDAFAYVQRIKPSEIRLDALGAMLKGSTGVKRVEEFWAEGDLEAGVEILERWIREAGIKAKNVLSPRESRMRGAQEDEDIPDIPTKDSHSDPWKTALVGQAARILLQDDKTPHATLSFAFNRLLGVKPRNIVTAYSAKRLDEVLEHLESQLATEYPFLGSRGWAKELSPLRAALNRPDAGGKRAGATMLRQYFRKTSAADQAKEVSEWVKEFDKRFRSRIHTFEEKFLRIVFDGPAPPWKKLSFAFHQILRVPGGYLPWISRLALTFLLQVFTLAYDNQRALRRRLTEGRLETSLREFRRSLSRPALGTIRNAKTSASHLLRRTGETGSITFFDFLLGTDRTERKSEILEWSSSVTVAVLHDLKREDSGLIYAYVCGNF